MPPALQYLRTENVALSRTLTSSALFFLSVARDPSPFFIFPVSAPF